MSNHAFSHHDIQKLHQLFEHADGLLFTAGAGMGVDSGLPDFRGNQGMWQAYPALGRQQMDFTQIANPHAFQQQPQLAWGFYGHRLALYRKTVPHHGFTLLLDIAAKTNLDYFVFTSNVDGQFQKAGFDANQIYECHGSIHYLQCLQHCTSHIWSADDLRPVIDAELCHWLGDLPTCPHCSQLARPNILMFGDWHWLDHRQQQQYTRLQNWLKNHKKPLVIELGAGTAIPTVRRFSEQFSPHVIRINLREAHFATGKTGLGLAMTARQGTELISQSLSCYTT